MVNFAAGGVATPADAALMMQMGMDGVFVGSGIFKAGNPAKRAKAIVQASTCKLLILSQDILVRLSVHEASQSECNERLKATLWILVSCCRLCTVAALTLTACCA